VGYDTFIPSPHSDCEGSISLPDREFRWVPAIDPSHNRQLQILDRRLREYYADSREYYQTIDVTKDNWLSDPAYAHVLNRLAGATKILEVGCGRANVLRSAPQLEREYSGVDLNEAEILRNRTQYPRARFQSILSAVSLPFADEEFDVVFSIFVLEHCVFPHAVIDEWLRVLKRHGRLIILCPAFLSRGGISSQRVGRSFGTGREKLRQGRIVDALLTGLDSRIRMPMKAHSCVLQSKVSPRF
jgi:SAM-dependent methyltransferase